MKTSKISFLIMAFFMGCYAMYLLFGSKNSLDSGTGQAAARKFILICSDVRDGMGQAKECVDFYNNEAPKIFRSGELNAFILSVGGIGNFKNSYLGLKDALEKSPDLGWTLRSLAEITNNQIPQ